MAYLTQHRQLYLKTPLPKNDLLLTQFEGIEEISRLSSFRLLLKAENHIHIPFERLLGQKVSFGVSADLSRGRLQRQFHGMVIRFAETGRGLEFTNYEMTVAPEIWKLTQIFRSRIFQQKTVPDILKEIFQEYSVDFRIDGAFDRREFCVQYQETDFDFASRLMEEEGLYYFFIVDNGEPKMAIGNSRACHPEVEGSSRIVFEDVEGGERPDERVFRWTKIQDYGSGKHTMWDHHFQLPGRHIECESVELVEVHAGDVKHMLLDTGGEALEIYEYPGRYAQRYDGVDKSGGDQSDDLQKVFEDRTRTSKIRIQEMESSRITIDAESSCRQLAAGHKFTLSRHFNANGDYLVTSVCHRASEGDYRSGEIEATQPYLNSFACIPAELTFRPRRVTSRPTIRGCQTATVVGPQGEDIFTDKYGRIKVQFHWDREGMFDANSSCWLRVATPWAGQLWGAIHIPRIGHEVLVDFIEGDPDRPIVVGSVYNALTMPPYQLPDEKTKSTIKSRSSPDGQGFNEIRFEDKQGSEQIFIHAQKDFDLRILQDRRETVLRDRHLKVEGDRYEELKGKYHSTVNDTSSMEVGSDDNLKVGGKMAIETGGSYSLTVGGTGHLHFKSGLNIEVGGTCHIKATTLVLEGASGSCLKCGGSFVTANSAGVQISGSMVSLNSGGAALSGPGVSAVAPAKPTLPKEADDAKPGGDEEQSGVAQARMESLNQKDKTKKSWVDIELVDPDGKPVPGESYTVTTSTGEQAQGTLDDKGKAHVTGLDPGSVKISFPNLHKDYWDFA